MSIDKTAVVLLFKVLEGSDEPFIDITEEELESISEKYWGVTGTVHANTSGNKTGKTAIRFSLLTMDQCLR